MKTNNLLDVINDMDNVARIAALRSVANSTLAKCIGAIRQHIRDTARAQRNEDEPQNDLDQRNDHDELHRYSNTDDANYTSQESGAAMGFKPRNLPMLEASRLHATHEWVAGDLKTLSTSMWDAPLTVEQMLDYMVSNAPKPDMATIRAVAAAAKIKEEDVLRLQEMEFVREREQLIEARPEILSTFNGFGSNCYEDAITDLPTLTQHQLGVKVVEGLYKARDRVLTSVLRTRRITDLASIPLIEDAAKAVADWVTEFERSNDTELLEALEAGRTIRSLDDVTPK